MKRNRRRKRQSEKPWYAHLIRPFRPQVILGMGILAGMYVMHPSDTVEAQIIDALKIIIALIIGAEMKDQGGRD